MLTIITNFLSAPVTWKHVLSFQALYFIGMGFARGRAYGVAKETPLKLSRVDVAERTLLMGTIVGYFSPTVWAVAKWWRGGGARPLPGDYRMNMSQFIAGSAVSTVGLYLLYRSHKDLGRNWSQSLELRKDHKLVTDGIYRTLRHPMYTGFLTMCAGFAIGGCPNRYVAPSYLVTMIALLAVRLPKEETMMLEEFGSQYSEYMKQTWRFFPYLF